MMTTPDSLTFPMGDGTITVPAAGGARWSPDRGWHNAEDVEATAVRFGEETSLYDLPAILAHDDEVAGFGARIVNTDAGFVLHWTDYVTGEWDETYPTLGVAVARLGHLIDTARAEEGFRLEADEFAVEIRRTFDNRDASAREALR